MSNNGFATDFFDNEKKKEGISIDYERVLFRALKYWYLIVLSLLIAFTIAYLKNRYGTRSYSVTSSIIIKETQETTEGKLLYNNPLASYARNYLNELYIIRSYPLIETVIRELNFGIAFYREGNFLTTEAYDYIPVKAAIINDDRLISSKKFIFRILNNQQFQLEPNGSVFEGQPIAKVFNFNDTIQYNGLNLVFQLRDGFPFKNFINEPFIIFYTSPDVLANSYANRLNAEWAEEGSGVVNLSIDGLNPSKEVDFLKGLITNYQKYDLERKNMTASRAIEFINRQLGEISDSLRKVELELELFKNKNVVTDLGTETLRLYKSIEDLEVQKMDLIVRDNYYKYLIDYIRTSENLDQVILPSSVGLNDAILSALISRMIDMQIDMKMILNDDKMENPLVSEKSQKIGEIKRDIIESVNNQRSLDNIKMNFLNKRINEVDKQLSRLPVTERQLVAIKRSYMLLENLYLFLMQKRAETGISKASTTSDITIVNPPKQAGGPITPKKNQNYTIAGVLGLFFPLIVFVLIEVLNNKVQSRSDIEKVSSIPFIGGIGHKSAANNQEVLTNPKSAIAESFRALRSNLNYFIQSKEKALFLITSSISGEGKTFASTNLAAVFALSGKKTLVVGADLRRPKLFNDFGLNNDVGLSTYLAQLATFDEVVQHTKHEHLDLISGGPVPPNPSELLLTARMDEFIAEAQKRYDYIIMDTPPLAIVTDAFVLTKYADHTLFIVRQNYTPRTLLRTTQELYQTSRLKNISIVLNDIYRSGPGYGYGYTYGYTYIRYGYGSKKKNDAYYS